MRPVWLMCHFYHIDYMPRRHCCNSPMQFSPFLLLPFLAAMRASHPFFSLSVYSALISSYKDALYLSSLHSHSP
ncbi:hypothetical protein CI102_3222 [Trichoderma harzianum]|uniref:Uncharacterized protein n=1 Tax=Trichoderma harzianum CBS 226.95 TaxID=983964 RepID=A0A2T4A658_TRIHA|nr:hypothetical protein M431DRAFT_465654 [Trichoderma harzianum CBS 226.95]PKK50367.1 hypothetical protein CI102_3222 [Trichoderma harzianum]PTB52572.1 hypothetical protein M431DRAFT_465654 [Trichoderma harzianum CBS 226.95]